jgi:hypothetical protein
MKTMTRSVTLVVKGDLKSESNKAKQASNNLIEVWDEDKFLNALDVKRSS